MKKLTKSLLFVATLGLSQGVYAEGFSIGAMAGQSSFGDLSDVCDGADSVPGLTITCDTDTTDTALGLNVSYDFAGGYGVELGYVNLGEFVTTLTGTASGFSAREEISLDLSAVYGAGKYMLEFSDKFGLTGRVGYFNPSADLGTSDGIDEIDTEADVYYGVSADYRITDDFTAQLRYDNFDVDMFSIGISYRFGG